MTNKASTGFASLPTTLGIIGGIITIFIATWNGVGYFKGIEAKNAQQDMRLDASDKDRERLANTIDKLSTNTGDLSEKVVRLTTVLEQSGITKKAALPDEGMVIKPTNISNPK